MTIQEILNKQFFPNSQESVLVEYTKNMIILFKNEKIDYSKDEMVIKVLNSIKDSLIKLKENDSFELLIYKPNTEIIKMPKIDNYNAKIIIDLLIDNLSKILTNMLYV